MPGKSSYPELSKIPDAGITRTYSGSIEHIDLGKGPALMTLHGGMGGYDQSWLLARALASYVQDFRIIALSRPGYLGTPFSVGKTPEQQADAYAALLDTLKIEKTLVAAVSAGGPSALCFALRHPSRCSGLVLVSAASGRLDVAPIVLSRLKTMQSVAQIPGSSWLMRQGVLLNPETAATQAIENREQVRTTLAHPEAGPLLRLLQAGVFEKLSERMPGTIHDTELFENLGAFPFQNITAPILILHGKADEVVPPSHGEAVAARARNARSLFIANGGHMALFTHMDKARAAFAKFVAEISPR